MADVLKLPTLPKQGRTGGGLAANLRRLPIVPWSAAVPRHAMLRIPLPPGIYATARQKSA